MVFLVVVIYLISSYIAGRAAFQAGLSVMYWACLGLILGPLVYPLFNTHKRFSLKRIQSAGDITLLG